MTNLRFATIFIFFIILNGCTQDNAVSKQEAVFFDLKEYFAKEKEIILQNTKQFKKTNAINGKEEEQLLDRIDLDLELSIFSDSDINRITWIDKYKTDSIFQKGRFHQLIYTAKEEKLRTNRIILTFETEKSPNKVEIENDSDSFIASSTQSLIYEREKGYTIKSKQNNIISGEQILSIEVLFQK